VDIYLLACKRNPVLDSVPEISATEAWTNGIVGEGSCVVVHDSLVFEASLWHLGARGYPEGAKCIGGSDSIENSMAVMDNLHRNYVYFEISCSS